ncbi:MAG: RDD family protein [Paenibacillus macerans]|uniref:RDD family protein n=1 Tax=Paenibacillus macerans TaxID=44252 RepID=UPI0029092B15|nr:RDD family protein [Paenibacillus macerans]MDU7472699.1 RDD family protein [Paenibacillus macerans]
MDEGNKRMYAGFWKRFAAYLLDFIVSYFLVLGVGLLGRAIRSIFGWWPASDSEISPSDVNPVNVLLSLGLSFQWFSVIKWLYYAIMESSKLQGTLGKMALGIVVVDGQNGRVSFWRASGRFWAQFLSILTVTVGYMMAGFMEKKQALHDKIARTYVVNKKVLEYGQGLTGQGNVAAHTHANAAALLEAFEEVRQARNR